MAPRKPKPYVTPADFTVVVGGKRRHVVGTTKECWIERLDTGQHVFHVGRLLTEGPDPCYWDDGPPRPCTRCKLPSHWTTKPRGTLRGRAVHPMCENTADVMPDALEAKVMFGAAVDLNATLIKEY